MRELALTLLKSSLFCSSHLSQNGELKLADFGLARAFGIPVRCYSAEVSWGGGIWGVREGISGEHLSAPIPQPKTLFSPLL